MISAKPELTPLESEAMDWLLRGEEPVLTALRRQFLSAQVTSRRITEYGFYLTFELPPHEESLLDSPHVKPDFYLGDVEADVDTLQRGIGFLLWIRNGKLDLLEGHTFDERWPTKVAWFKFRYMGRSRDWHALRRQWEIEGR
jgi:hypothetical protein